MNIPIFICLFVFFSFSVIVVVTLTLLQKSFFLSVRLFLKFTRVRDSYSIENKQAARGSARTHTRTENKNVKNAQVRRKKCFIRNCVYEYYLHPFYVERQCSPSIQWFFFSKLNGTRSIWDELKTTLMATTAIIRDCADDDSRKDWSTRSTVEINGCRILRNWKPFCSLFFFKLLHINKFNGNPSWQTTMRRISMLYNSERVARTQQPHKYTN